MTENFYGTDLKENATDDLEKLSKFLELTKENKGYWRWVIIALHGSLYKFMLLALGGSVYSEIWKETVKKEKVDLVYKINPFSPENKNKLISFLKAFEEIKSTEKMGDKPFVSTLEIDEDMKTLNTDLRNRICHFIPASLLIDTRSIKEIIQSTLPIIRFIISDFRSNGVGRARVLIEENERLAIDAMLKKITFQTKP